MFFCGILRALCSPGPSLVQKKNTSAFSIGTWCTNVHGGIGQHILKGVRIFWPAMIFEAAMES